MPTLMGTNDPRPPEHSMAVREFRIAAAGFVLTSLLIVAMHVLTS